MKMDFKKLTQIQSSFGFCSSPCTFRSRPAELTKMLLRELSHAA